MAEGTGGSSSSPVVRMARRSDADELYRLARAGGDGLTNLPPDRQALVARLEASERALASDEAREEGAAILMVASLEERVVATSCVFPRVGAAWPFYSYRLTRHSSRSVALGKRQDQVVLVLANDFDGECEVGGLFVDPDCRGRSVGRLAAQARYLFIAAHRAWFGRRVIAELRGYQDADGNSPVWEAIGRHFYDMAFAEADRTGALSGNQFIADLGPRHPIYVSMLPRAAQDALGRPHDDGYGALQMLLDEGFNAGEYVDVFDGGITLVADVDAVRSVAGCTAATLRGVAKNRGGAVPSLVACGTGEEFRVTRGSVPAEGEVDADTARALDLAIGDPFLHVPT